MSSKKPVDRFDSPKMAGICVFCNEADECYSTPKKCIADDEAQRTEGGAR